VSDDESFEGNCPTCGQHYHPRPRRTTIDRNPLKPCLNAILDEIDRITETEPVSRATIDVASFNRLATELGYRGKVSWPEAIVIAHPNGNVTITPEDM
jgi:hypothetical protein